MLETREEERGKGGGRNDDGEIKEGGTERGGKAGGNVEGLVEAAARLYRSFPGYAEGEAEYGACAIEVEVMQHR